MFMSLPSLAIVILAGAAAFFGIKWLLTKDGEIEQRRLNAGKLAAKLQEYGLKRTPRFLQAYSCGDYSLMFNEIKDLGTLFLEGDKHVIDELEATFGNVLAAKLKTEEGRAFIAAKVAEATPAVAK